MSIYNKGFPNFYKYRPDEDYVIDEIERSYLYFPQRKELNDPYDCHPDLITIDTSEKSVRKYLEKRILPKTDMNLNRHEKRKMSKELYLKDEKLMEQYASMKKIVDQHGIGCFTLEYSNFMMWYFYASKHKGLCFHFDTTEDKDFFDGIDNVNYVVRFEQVEWDLNDNENIEPIKHLFYTKSDVWTAEKEYRVIKEFQKQQKHTFNKAALKRVIVGSKTKDSFTKKVLAASLKYSELEVYKAHLINTQFGIGLERIG